MRNLFSKVFVLLAILALFLGLQFLPKLLYKRPPVDGESR